MSITNANDLFRKIDEYRIRAEVEERTEKQTIHLIACWLRILDKEDLAKRVEEKEWYPMEWRDADGNPRP
jgi:hypothetical protein